MLALRLLDFFINTSKLLLNTRYSKKTLKYVNDTAGSMLRHISPAAYIYKESFTLYTTPQKGEL